MFSFLNLSPSAQARMRARKTGATKLRYTFFEKLKEERAETLSDQGSALKCPGEGALPNIK